MTDHKEYKSGNNEALKDEGDLISWNVKFCPLLIEI